MTPLIIEAISYEIEGIFWEKIDGSLRINGTRKNMPKWANITFDYSMFENGLNVYDDTTFEMSVNGTFFDGSKNYKTAYSPITYEAHFSKMFNG